MMESTCIRCLKYLACIGLLVLFYPVTGQNRDSILLFETTLTRPLLVHQNQLRFSTGFAYEAHNIEYKGTEAVRLADDARAGNGNEFRFKAQYGILENLELSFATSYLKRDFRDKYVVVADVPVYELYFSQSRIGWSDPELSMTYRAPLPRHIDLLVGGIVRFPLFKYGQLQPKHSIVMTAEEDPANNIQDSYRINYADQEGNGAGVLVMGLKAALKYRLSDQLAVTLAGQYQRPSSTTTDKDWYYLMIDNERFVYSSESFTTQIQDLSEFSGAIEYQFFPFFNAYIQVNHQNRKYGWYESDAVKYKLPNQSLTGLRVGYEIIATPRTWFAQYFELPLAGEDSPAPFIIQLQLRYNLML